MDRAGKLWESLLRDLGCDSHRRLAPVCGPAVLEGFAGNALLRVAGAAAQPGYLALPCSFTQPKGALHKYLAYYLLPAIHHRRGGSRFVISAHPQPAGRGSQSVSQGCARYSESTRLAG